MEKKRITIIDILIIMFVILVAVVAITKLKPAVAPKPGVPITYTVLVTNQYPEVAEKIVPDENVILDTTTNSYGSITAVDLKPAENIYLDAENGRYVKRINEERNDVYLTVNVTAEEHDWGYDVGEQHIRVGEKQLISGRGFATTGYIVDVQY